MYGRAKKCKELIEADKEFFQFCDKDFSSRAEASKYYAARGWDYIDSNDLNTAIKRFNQAWMLDTNNASVYWGFGVVLGKQKQYQESIPYLERAIGLDKKDPNLYGDAANSYFNWAFNAQQKDPIKIGIKHIEQAIKLNPSNNRNYRQLAVGYYYLGEVDSAKKYMNICDEKDKSLIEPDLREALKEMIKSSK